MEKEIIKENYITTNGGFLPLADFFYGQMRLTKEKLIIDYYLFSIVWWGEVRGSWKRSIEIPIEDIIDISIAQHRYSGMLKIVYSKKLKTKKIYISPYFLLHDVRMTELIKTCNEWVEEVNRLKDKTLTDSNIYSG